MPIRRRGITYLAGRGREGTGLDSGSEHVGYDGRRDGMSNDGWEEEKKEERKERYNKSWRARNVVEALQRIVSFLGPPNPV